MSSRRLLLPLAALATAAVAASAAVAGRSQPAASVTTIKAVTSVPKVKINRYIQDGLRWDKDVYKVKSGGTIHIVNDAAEEGPHTFTVLAPPDEPKTALQIVNCKICEKIGRAH